MEAKSAEDTLDEFLDRVAQMAKNEGLTVAVAASVPVGKMHCTRIMAQSAQDGAYGRALCIHAMESMAHYCAYLKGEDDRMDHE